jgi:hypothetical protein
MGETPPASSPVESSRRRTLRRILRTVAIIGLVIILIPGYSFNETVDTATRSFWLGLPFSPWLQYTDEQAKTEAGTKHSTKMGIEFLSLSFLVGVIACAAEWGEKKLRPKVAG